MSWFPEPKLSFLERMAISILRKGNVPTHVAFIMDGNRRFAKKLNSDKLTGHTRGFEKLAEALSWCRDIGITQATLYAFSIENFKRPKAEVDGLMDLFRDKFKKFEEEYDKLEKYQVRINVLGKIDLLPDDIQRSIANVVIRTKKFSKFNLNICFSYTSREEITSAMNDLHECVDKGIIEPYDINEVTLSNAMYSAGLPNPDLLVRTSGEIRLSDFLLWQSSFSVITFIQNLWPDFTLWDLLYCVFRYQLECNSIFEARERYYNALDEEDNRYCKEIFAQNSTTNSDFKQFVQQRQKRIENCSRYIQQKRLLFLEKLFYDKSIQENKYNTSCDINIADKLNNTNTNGCIATTKNGHCTSP